MVRNVNFNSKTNAINNSYGHKVRILVSASLGRCLMKIGWTEILFILVLVLLLFGSKRLPDLARSLGKSFSEFKKGLSDITKETKDGKDD